MVLGPQFHEYYGIWALKPCYLGPWTLREYIVRVDPAGRKRIPFLACNDPYQVDPKGPSI